MTAYDNNAGSIKKLSVYVHIPFCERKCEYCDFVSFKCNANVVDEYIERLVEEITSFNAVGYVVDSIFFGGGTPTLLSCRQFEKIVSAIRGHFVCDLVEFTVEGNPNSYTAQKIDTYKRLGVTRLSVGVQSLNDEVLKGLGRLHDAQQAENCLKMLVASGLDVNCDLMLGVPYQTMDMVQRDVQKVVSLGVSSVSCYSLIVEDGTPLKAKLEARELTLPSEDETVDMYDLAAKILQKSGLNRYEVSNFGKLCYHNVGYWTQKEYVGFGVAAHSFYCGARYAATNDLSEFIHGAERVLVQELSSEDMRKEYAMLALRMDSGIDTAEYKAKFGDVGFAKLIAEIGEDAKYYDIDERSIAIKPKYSYCANSLICKLI